MKRALFAALLTMLPLAAQAQEHLEPHDSPLFAYMQLQWPSGIDVLSRFFHKDVLALQAAHYDVFMAAYAVGIERHGVEYRIFGVTNHKGPARRYCTAALDGTLPQRIVGAWTTVLMQTRYAATPRSGADGLVSHFAVRAHTQILSGKIWSPRMPGNPALLERISMAMHRACEAGKLTPKDRGEIEDYLSRIR